MKQIPNAFASQNTTAGFRSFFSEIFNRDTLQKIIILKGGPGTGKSHLLKTAASKWEKNGGCAELFSCSSDPDSLDAVLFREIGVAILDGTSPHTFDAVYPGAVEEIFDPGAFWKSSQIERNTDLIRSLVKTKKAAFHSAELFLSGAGILFKEIQSIAKGALDREKMKKAIDRCLKKENLSADLQKTPEIRLTESFNHLGLCRSSAFQDQAETVYCIKDEILCGPLFLNEIGKKLEEKRVFHIRSFSAVFPDQISGLFLPESKTAFILGDVSGYSDHPPYRFVNMKRFLSEEALKSNRAKIRFLKKTASFLLSESQKCFAAARDAHIKLESLYTPAMNFEKMNRSFQKLLSALGI